MSRQSLPRSLGASLLVLWSVSAFSQSYPSWAIGRDANGKLIVNSGTLGNVTFASEYKGSYPNEGENAGCTPRDRVAYDWTEDGYQGRPLGSCRTVGACAKENLDLAHPAWNSNALRHVLVRNWNVKNAFKTNSAPHVDVSQVYDSPGWGGWFVMQDSALKNSDDGIVQWQFGYQGNGTCGAYAGKNRSEFGGVVVQGVTLNQESGFVADCRARNTDPVCQQGNYLGSWNPGEGWLINYQTNGWGITLQQRWKKVVIVGNLPDISFRTGDAYAFSTDQACTVAPCSFSGKVFGPYPSIEAAIAAGHAEPPFVRLSCSGWGDTRNCAASASAPQALAAPANLRLQ
jgi:hypothetical protein